MANPLDTQKLLVGVSVLLVVDLIWVASSELTKYIFKNESYDKPVFSTYLKTSMFSIYLFGFLISKTWRNQCRQHPINMYIDPNNDNDHSVPGYVEDPLISDPRYLPIKFHDGSGDKSSGTESDDSSSTLGRSRAVRFSKLAEVRQLSESQADDANLARLSYNASLRAQEEATRLANKLSIRQVSKIALQFTLLFFFGNCAYQVALSNTEAGMVNILSSTSALFTLILAAIFPANSNDRFTISKLLAVIISIAGVVLVTLSDVKFTGDFPYGAIWALVGAFCYAVYIVMLRRKVDSEDRIDVSMFFGFVGLFCLVLLWPSLIILHYTQLEIFMWPNHIQLSLLLVNGLIGTVFSELLWLIGCFLSSSLIGTLALSLTIPMTVIVDISLKGVHYSRLLYIGVVPVFFSFFAVTLLAYYENWDPVANVLKRLLLLICSRRKLARLRDIEKEQTESLIGINNDQHDA